MRINRFYRPEVTEFSQGSKLTIHDVALSHQLKNVLRLQKGDVVALFSKQTDDMLCAIEEIERTEVTFVQKSLAHYKTVSPSFPECIVVMPAIRKEKLGFLVDTLGQLGVARLVLCNSDFAQPRFYSVGKLQRIAVEACEQSMHKMPMKIIEEDKDCVELCTDSVGDKYYGTLKEDAKGVEKDNHTAVTGNVLTTYLFIGPEGGWSEREEVFFAQHAKPLSLGGAVLRAETAALIGAAKLQELWCRKDKESNNGFERRFD
jgi:16S rRNA (uracil1498-N3)-methyltransferase